MVGFHVDVLHVRLGGAHVLGGDVATAQAFDEVAATLDVIERLQPSLVIPGHGKVFADVSQALGGARSRLKAYVARPERHAAHAAKVLLKFKLLELQSAVLADFVQWAQSTRYFQLVHARWFDDIGIRDWISGLVAELSRSGAVNVRAHKVFNT